MSESPHPLSQTRLNHRITMFVTEPLQGDPYLVKEEDHKEADKHPLLIWTSLRCRPPRNSPFVGEFSPRNSPP